MAGSDEVKKVEPSGDTDRDRAIGNSSITNSEEGKLVKARIFVGNLPADLRTEKGDVYDKFRKHGRIIGVSIHNRFAFVQFENESDARTAVKEENHTDFRSSRLEIKMAIEGRAMNRNRDDRDRRRSRSPLDRDRRRDSRDRSRRRDSRDRERRGASRDNYRGRRTRTPTPPPYIPTPVEDRFCHPRTYGANDVELVVIRKQQGPYAESILRRLYECRITANVLFLAEHAALDGAVNEFGRCGTHYVIIIMPKHEETRALTINMFEGTEKPREYRNLNFEEGIALITRHFNEHYPALARLRMAEIQGPNFYPPAPVEVTRTLTRVAEMSAVPTSSLDSAIRYLQEMRERTAAFEGLAPQPVVAAAGPYVPPPMDTGIGKPYSGMDDRSRLMANSDSDTIRDSLLGLLKATGLSGAQAAMAAAPAPYPGTADYRGGGGGGSSNGGGGGGYSTYTAYGPSAGGASQALTTGSVNLADPVVLQKALASLGVLGGGGGGGQNQGLGGNPVPAGGVGGQQTQSQTQAQREPQSGMAGMAAYRAASGGGQSQRDEENGTGYSSQTQGGQPMDRTGASQYQQYQNGHSQLAGGGHGQQLSSGGQMGGARTTFSTQGSVGAAGGGGQVGSLYVTTAGGGGAGGAGGGGYLQAPQQQQIQRSMQQQQPQQQSVYGAAGSRR